jgi:membrane associated rhomboid family serine protease
MLFAIPISTGKRITAPPYITLGLIAINLIIWAITTTIMTHELEAMSEVREQMWNIEKIYIDEFVWFDFRNMPPAEHDQMIMDGRIIPPDSEDFTAWEQLLQNYQSMQNSRLYKRVGFTPNEFNVIKMIISLFIHGSFMHLLGNVLFLWLAGCNLESDIGWKKFLGFYFFFGLIAALVYYLSNPSSEIPIIGASGAIAGLMGAFMVRFYLTKIKFFYFMWLLRPIWGVVRIPAYICLPFWFIQQLFSVSRGSDTGVAFWAHIGGFITGAGTIFIARIMNLLPEQDPESDDEDDYLQSSVKEVKKLQNKDAIINNASPDNLPQLMAIVRAEPENVDALLALARLQFNMGAPQDSAVSYNLALNMVLSLKNTDRIRLIFNEMKLKSLLKHLSNSNTFQLVILLEKIGKYKDAVNIAILFISLFPKDSERPGMIYKIYQICKAQLKDEVCAQKAAALLKRDYPHLPQDFFDHSHPGNI